MQPETGSSEDIHAILGRFSTWNSTQSTSGNGRSLQIGSDEVRELAYEEAIRRYGSWPPVLTTMAKAAASALQKDPDPTPSAVIAEIPQSTMAASDPISVPAPLERGEEVSAAQENPKVRSAATARKVPAKTIVHAAGNRAKQPHALTVGEEKVPSKKAVSSRDTAARLAKPVAAKNEKKGVSRSDGPALLSRKNVAPPAEMEQGTPAPKTAGGRRAAFCEVLAAAVPANPERNTRISIRLSAQEESRFRKSAAEAGLTVSAYLRKCALQADASRSDVAVNGSARLSQGATSRTRPQLNSGLGARLAAWLGGLRQHSA